MVLIKLSESLAFLSSMGNPQSGVMFHSCGAQHMDFDKLGQNLIRPAAEALRLEWHGLHGFRRGIASNLYELGANDKVVQRILRHAKPHVTKERYIKAFDPAVLSAMKSMEASLDMLNASHFLFRWLMSKTA
jgi:integrase